MSRIGNLLEHVWEAIAEARAGFTHHLKLPLHRGTEPSIVRAGLEIQPTSEAIDTIQRMPDIE